MQEARKHAKGAHLFNVGLIFHAIYKIGGYFGSPPHQATGLTVKIFEVELRKNLAQLKKVCQQGGYTPLFRTAFAHI